MFTITREDLTNTLTEMGYLIEIDNDSHVRVYSDESLLTAILFATEENEVISGEYITAGEWYNDTPDGVVEYLAILANMDNEEDELSDFPMTDDEELELNEDSDA